MLENVISRKNQQLEISEKRNKEISNLIEKKVKAETFIIELDEEIAEIT